MATKKRRHTAVFTSQAATKQQTSRKRARAALCKCVAISRFLDLPAELRVNIYEKALEDYPAYLPRNGARPNLATKCKLVAVSKQIRKEFVDAMFLSAPILKTTVRNYNFAHLIGFLNKLTEAQLAKLHAQDQVPARRIICIKLVFQRPREEYRYIDHQPFTSIHYQQTKRWLNRFDAPEKKGTQIDYIYEVDQSYFSNTFSRIDLGLVITGMGEKKVAEAHKIRQAIQAAMERWTQR